MTIVPTKLTFIAGAASLVVIGAVFTLVHRSTTLPVSYNADSSTSADITPTLASQGVVENPSDSITVNGVPVPAKSGTTRVDTPNGTATVQVSGNGGAVDTQTSKTGSSTSEGSLQVTVSSTSNGTSSHGSSYVNSSSHSTVSGSGNSSVHIETHNSN